MFKGQSAVLAAEVAITHGRHALIIRQRATFPDPIIVHPEKNVFCTLTTASTPVSPPPGLPRHPTAFGASYGTNWSGTEKLGAVSRPKGGRDFRELDGQPGNVASTSALTDR